MDDRRSVELRIRSEEDRGAEDALESCDQPAVLFAAFVHTEGLEHFGRGSEANHLTLLADSEGGKEDGHEAALAERNAELRMTNDLEEKLALRSLVDQLTGRRSTQRQSAEDEGP